MVGSPSLFCPGLRHYLCPHQIDLLLLVDPNCLYALRGKKETLAIREEQFMIHARNFKSCYLMETRLPCVLWYERTLGTLSLTNA